VKVLKAHHSLNRIQRTAMLSLSHFRLSRISTEMISYLGSKSFIPLRIYFTWKMNYIEATGLGHPAALESSLYLSKCEMIFTN